MALGRVEFSQTQMIVPGDSAVGPKANWGRYREDWDAKHLDLQPGVQPTTFLIKQLSEEQKRGLHPLGYGKSVDEVPRACAMATIQCALLGWDNYQVATVTGVRTVEHVTPSDFEDAGSLGRILSDAALCRLGLIQAQWRNLYQMIVLFSEPSLPLSKPSAPQPGQPSL